MNYELDFFPYKRSVEATGPASDPFPLSKYRDQSGLEGVRSNGTGAVEGLTSPRIPETPCLSPSESRRTNAVHVEKAPWATQRTILLTH